MALELLISGSRENLLSGLKFIVSSLEKGDEQVSVFVPDNGNPAEEDSMELTFMANDKMLDLETDSFRKSEAKRLSYMLSEGM